MEICAALDQAPEQLLFGIVRDGSPTDTIPLVDLSETPFKPRDIVVVPHEIISKAQLRADNIKAFEIGLGIRCEQYDPGDIAFIDVADHDILMRGLFAIRIDGRIGLATVQAVPGSRGSMARVNLQGMSFDLPSEEFTVIGRIVGGVQVARWAPERPANVHSDMHN